MRQQHKTQEITTAEVVEMLTPLAPNSAACACNTAGSSRWSPSHGDTQRFDEARRCRRSPRWTAPQK